MGIVLLGSRKMGDSAEEEFCFKLADTINYLARHAPSLFWQVRCDEGHKFVLLYKKEYIGHHGRQFVACPPSLI